VISCLMVVRSEEIFWVVSQRPGGWGVSSVFFVGSVRMEGGVWNVRGEDAYSCMAALLALRRSIVGASARVQLMKVRSLLDIECGEVK